jgi:hypothetical protein
MIYFVGYYHVVVVYSRGLNLFRRGLCNCSSIVYHFCSCVKGVLLLFFTHGVDKWVGLVLHTGERQFYLYILKIHNALLFIYSKYATIILLFTNSPSSHSNKPAVVSLLVHYLHSFFSLITSPLDCRVTISYLLQRCLFK